MTNPLLLFVGNVCVQTAVYWGSPVETGYGKRTYASPIEINVRWDEEVKVLRDKNGEEVFSTARILLTQDVEENAMIALTTLSALSTEQKNDPMKVPAAYSILRYTKTPLFMSSTEFVREAYLWQTETG